MAEGPQDPGLQHPSGEIPQTTQSFRKKSPVALAMLGGAGCLVLTILVVAGAYFFFRSIGKEELELVNNQLYALGNNDIDRAYSYCSLQFQKTTSKEEFIELVEDYPILKNAKEFSSLNRKKDATGPTILKGTITGKDGSKLPAEYQLIRENDKWKIQFLQLSPAGIAVEDSSRPVSPVSQPKVDSPQVSVVKSLQIANVEVLKNKDGDRTSLIVKFQVLNFANDKSTGVARIHLVQDVKTIDPAGNIVPDLSKNAIKELQESGQPEYKSTEFEYKLTIPPIYAPGRYQMVITVHDRVGGTATAATAQFEIP